MHAHWRVCTVCGGVGGADLAPALRGRQQLATTAWLPISAAAPPAPQFVYPEDWAPVTTSGNDVFLRSINNVETNVFVELSSPSSSRYTSVADLGSPREAAGGGGRAGAPGRGMRRRGARAWLHEPGSSGLAGRRRQRAGGHAGGSLQH